MYSYRYSATYRADVTRNIATSQALTVSDEDASETVRKLARLEGIFGGTTSGANVWAAIQRARVIGPVKEFVTVTIHSGLKYLNADFI